MGRANSLLEFDKIRVRLAAETTTTMGREMVEDLQPTTDLAQAQRWQSETTEAVSLLRRHNIGLEGIPDLRVLLDQAARGRMLSEEQLHGVLFLLSSATRIKTAFREKEGFPCLKGMIEQMSVLPELREKLREAIDEDGRLRDKASPELARLKRAINSAERELRERFDRFIRNPVNQKALQEILITVRSERLVLPVRQEYRSSVPGVVHDQSASGATLFIEPLWAVEAHNRQAILRGEAQKEKDRILTALSQWVGGEKEQLHLTLTLYGELDFIVAKGRLSIKSQGVEPQLNDRGCIKMRAGRHPLLTGKVVPIDLEIGGDFRTLVITGPNTGGKTVTLKTVGLFSLMAQAGLHISADQGSEMAVFPAVFVDIGDEQDIEQSLSTFSGHLKNITGIVEHLIPGALVLLDEVGAGTDPAEGAGLAMALLEYLHDRRAVTIATTHYSQLKAFAYLTDGMENASVEFDAHSLSPTYRLLVGVPGQSNAFIIARRLGLEGSIIERARTFLSKEETRLEEVVAELVAGRKKMELDWQQAKEDRLEADILLERLKKEQAEISRRRAEILEKTKAEAVQILSQAKKEASRALKEVRKLPNLPKEEAERGLQNVVDTLSLEQDVLQEKQDKPEVIIPSRADLYPGREVLVNSLNQRGVITLVTENSVQVQVGVMRIQVDSNDLTVVKASSANRQANPPLLHYYPCRDIPNEVSVRGLTMDEAVMKLEAYLDDVMQSDHREVRLIHGKGTGRLRSGLRDYLKRDKRIISMRTGYPSEGGTGVTVLELNR